MIDINELTEGVDCSICGAPLDETAEEHLADRLDDTLSDSMCTDEDINNVLEDALCSKCQKEDDGDEV